MKEPAADAIALQRAQMPEGTHKVLDKRTVESDNSNLLKWLKEGISVLDVGCGSGSITKGIAAKVGASGKVTGIDNSEHLISIAQNNYADIPNLSFEVADLYHYASNERYDIVTAARVLQWVSDPATVLSLLKDLVKEKGVIAILDYNHEKIQWNPAPPPSMQQFYNAFLQWRKDAGFDNAMADHLAELFKHLGCQQINIEAHPELSQRSDPDFIKNARIWSQVAETRGHQLVKDGYITEDARLAAIKDYDTWLASEGQSMQLYLLAVEAIY